MSSSSSSYRNILKAFGIFGGVQVVTILVLLVRSKVVAIYLGPSGLGVATLFNSTLATIGAIIGLGISFSAVREIAAANSTEDKFLIGQTITVFRKWIWFTGFVGVFIIVVFARQISVWTFGSNTYTYSFVFLAITILLTAYTNGQKTILQGLGKLKKMANMTIWSSILGLVTLPLYYLFGLNGIVPAIIITAIISVLISWYISKDVKVQSVKIENRQVFILGMSMVKIGLLVTISGLFYTLGTYVLNIFINKINGPNDVGLYQAGWMITNQAVGLVFAAMSVDYYPRLAALNKDNIRINEQVNHQAEIMLLIIGTIVSLLIIFIPFVIKLLLTDSFLTISNFVRLSSLGILFKAVHWCLGYVILAKGDTRLYIISEFSGTTIMFLSYFAGYYYLGIDGIGYAFILSYIIYLSIYYFILNKGYGFKFNETLIKIFLIITSISTLIYLVSLLVNGTLNIFLVGTLALTLVTYSIKELNKRISFKGIFNQFVTKKL